MKSTSRREGPASALSQAGARSGKGANSLVPYIDQDEDEKPNGTTAGNDGTLDGGERAGDDGEKGGEAPS